MHPLRRREAEPLGTVVGMVLAAGAGRRLGQPKALVCDDDGTPWVWRAAETLQAAGAAAVYVVVGAEAEAVRTVVPPGCVVVEAPDWNEGMGASLRAGLSQVMRERLEDAAVLVMLVDTPDVGEAVVRRLLSGARPDVLSRATYDGVPGHPVLIGREHWRGVLEVAAGDRGARHYLRDRGVTLIDCDDLGSGRDVDTAADLGEWRDVRQAGQVPRLPDAAARSPLPEVASAGALAERLSRTGYLTDDGLATIGYLALAMHRPLLLEGEPGTGKTALAEALAEALGVDLIRLQCHEGIDASQALYDWDFARQILHLRTVEAVSGDREVDQVEVEKSLFDERFLLARPILQALRESPVVLLIDEIDRADDEFEAFLLEVLSTNQVTIPEYGTVRATHPPIVVLTSNRTREVHDALKRRCLYHWVDHPGLEREIEIVRRRLPDVPPLLAEQVARATQRLRARDDLVKPPGVAETLDWAQALHTLGASELDLERAASTLGAVLKYREDAERVRASLDKILAA
ncbi:MAG: NTP transferase domain-containing protein [Nocardioidaceae bacterium]|nr:NTP transferase domain-containing protein [Nocardioidaceae bacterium]